MTDTGGILTVILASRMTGNPQGSGKIFGQNHALYLMSQIGFQWGKKFTNTVSYEINGNSCQKDNIQVKE